MRVRPGPRRSQTRTGTVARPRYRPNVPAAPAPADLGIGAFSNTPPWLVDPDQLLWRHGLAELRRRTSAEVPSLLQRRRLPPGRRVITVGADLGIALAGWYVVERRRSRRRGDPSVSRTGLS